MNKFEPKAIKDEDWGQAVALAIVGGLGERPDVLLDIVAGGERAFVKNCRKTDVYNLSDDVYKQAFRRIEKRVKRMAPPRV